MKKGKIAILLGIMCMFLTLGICVQIKTVNESSTRVGKTQTENALRDSVLKWKEKYDSIYNEENQKENELDKLREEVLSQNTDSENIDGQLKDINILLGYNEVYGQGDTSHSCDSSTLYAGYKQLDALYMGYE